MCAVLKLIDRMTSNSISTLKIVCEILKFVELKFGAIIGNLKVITYFNRKTTHKVFHN